MTKALLASVLVIVTAFVTLLYMVDRAERRRISPFSTEDTVAPEPVVPSTATAPTTAVTATATTTPTTAPAIAPAPNMSNDDTLFELVAVAVEKRFGTDSDILHDPNTPQFKAIEWFSVVDRAISFPVETVYDEIRFRQRYALVVFYYALGGEAWVNDCNFLTEEHACRWHCAENRQTPTLLSSGNGASCEEDEMGFVTALELVQNNPQGTIPPEIAHLDLTILNIHGGKVTGSIPSEIYNQRSLRYLHLQEIDLRGYISSEVGNLVNLVELRLQDNPKLGGTLPTEIGSLTLLEELSIASAQLTGAMPETVSKLQLLSVLNLHGNKLTMLPSIFPSTLKRLDLGNNILKGSISDGLSLLTSLQVLDLSKNDLSGRIPESIVGLGALEEINLGDNSLSGTLPNNLGWLSILRVLTLSNNFVSGTIPTSVGGLTSLVELDLSYNSVTGSVPQELCSAISLESLALSGNELTGTVPSCLGEIEKLAFTSIFSNLLTGEVSFMCDMRKQGTSFVLADCKEKVTCTCCAICCDQQGQCSQA